ncbi:hypothetical protein GCM10023157_07220 [Gluconacetobacter asukensis]
MVPTGMVNVSDMRSERSVITGIQYATSRGKAPFVQKGVMFKHPTPPMPAQNRDRRVEAAAGLPTHDR